MTTKDNLELLRRLRLLSMVKDRPVTLPYPLFTELLKAALGGVVDEAWYLDRYPDVAAAIKQGTFQSALHHYFASGMQEGRMPYPAPIDELEYLARHKDVAKAVKAGKLQSAAEHFYLTGFVEGRAFQLESDSGGTRTDN